MHARLFGPIVAIAKRLRETYFFTMRFAAAVILALFLALSAAPAPACQTAMPAMHHGSTGGSHDPAQPAAAHVCIGCATPLPDPLRPAGVPWLLTAAPLALPPLARPAEWRPGFEPPPPRPLA